MAYDLSINGERMRVDVEPDTPLLWVLRDELKLTGTKFGCGQALFGACTVHADGAPIRSCQTSVADAATMKIVTIEGLAGKPVDAVRAAWRELDVPQCGYCQSGQIMSATALLAGNASPGDADIDGAMDGNVCRCATYHRIRAGIHRAAEIMKG
jgi:isoquinoline 1-oxidoreductase alpha subunit